MGSRITRSWFIVVSIKQSYSRIMATTQSASGRPAEDLRGIRVRGGSYQVRVYSGMDPVSGE